MTNAQFRTISVQANDLTFQCLEMGEGPLALCLHGFPDSAMTWRHLMPALAAAGYRAVAPYMRGYSPTTVPAEVKLDANGLALAFSADIGGLHQALGGDENSVLIGHDWGAFATYIGALHGASNWRRCVAMGVPPLQVFSAIGSSYTQIKRSFYFWFFQMAVAEEIVAADNLAFIDRLWADWSPGYDASADLVHAKRSIGSAANLSAALGYYRSFFNPADFSFADPGYPSLPQPLLYLHGANDGCIALDTDHMAAVSGCAAAGSRAMCIEDSGHFLHLERPALINRLVVDFLEVGR